MNIIGNIFSGQLVGETAKHLSERFGKVLQRRQSLAINRNDKSTQISTQMDSLIPQSKISILTQGVFIGAISDNFDERKDQKISTIIDFHSDNGKDRMVEQIQFNYDKIKSDVTNIVLSELERIKSYDNLEFIKTVKYNL